MSCRKPFANLTWINNTYTKSSHSMRLRVALYFSSAGKVLSLTEEFDLTYKGTICQELYLMLRRKP